MMLSMQSSRFTRTGISWDRFEWKKLREGEREREWQEQSAVNSRQQWQEQAFAMANASINSHQIRGETVKGRKGNGRSSWQLAVNSQQSASAVGSRKSEVRRPKRGVVLAIEISRQFQQEAYSKIMEELRINNI